MLLMLHSAILHSAVLSLLNAKSKTHFPLQFINPHHYTNNPPINFHCKNNTALITWRQTMMINYEYHLNLLEYYHIN